MSSLVKKLESIRVKAANGNGEVWVYDGDVDYRPSAFCNYAFYRDSDGKRWKTRPYTQFTLLTNRRKSPRSGDKTKVERSELFQTYDNWVSWAENQAGFMHEDVNGNLYQLDKDILGDSKLYHEDVCVFVPPYLNGGYALWEGFSKEARRDILLRMVNEDFGVVDDRVVETFMNMAEFNYGLPCLIGMSEEDFTAREGFLKRVCQVHSWKDLDDINTGVSFKDYDYSIKFNIGGKAHSESGFDHPIPAITKKLDLKIDFMENLKLNIENHGKFVEENFYKGICEKLDKFKFQKYLVNKDPKKLSPRIKIYSMSYI